MSESNRQALVPGTVLHIKKIGEAVINHVEFGEENGHEWVDLGLSVKWATCNVGAASPGDYGSYFAWGEISAKENYGRSNYKCGQAKYNRADGRLFLEMSDDAARTNWGGGWRMPTKTEFDELINNCTWTWTTQDGKNGYKVTSKKNGNSIFLPATGRRYGSSVHSAGADGYYWSSSLRTDSPDFAWYLFFSSSFFSTRNDYRCSGRSVRPVIE
jgi:uncharacterized protein (TIGR02145 family)